MDKNSAAKLVHDTFQNPFDKGRFVYFVKNLCVRIEIENKHPYSGNYIPDPYRTHIRTLQRIGKYEDAGKNKIDILVIHLKKEKALERARTMQRNFIAWYLDGSRGGIPKEAALVAFVSPDCEDWRFSLVKMDYKLDTSGKRLRVRKEPTPARRHSFLVGKNENSHTAQSRLAPILKDDGHNPTLEELELAFSVEKVTKEFFTKYRDLFHRVEEALKQILTENPQIKQEFSEKSIETADFAKKLLGQIVFLYFLQKKGWFGVARDADWGTGPKDFLRRLFEKKYDNFFNDILEPLFYDALARDRSDVDYFNPQFDCKIPFLNGGLFDALNNYDWAHRDILLPNDLFSNKRKTKEGSTGDGILDVFDRFNFTVKEDEPLEKEVAVDPEMLGKVFENLLEVKDRKSKGTYYTPREIVHYMCQESLVNYLITETGVDNDRVRNLVSPKVLTKKDYRKYRRGGGSKDDLFEGSVLALWEGEAEKLDAALANIKVCDPACGSGAFLVGMLQEIVHTRKRLAFALDKDTSIYELKQHAIQNSLYGVDIDPGAVEIAKLRLWLSLVVDEEDIKNIRPLPNLDYKIMQGNSLLEEYEGVKLFDMGISSGQKNFLELVSDAERLTKELQRLKEEFFKASLKSEKDYLKRKIDDLTWELIEATLKEQDKADKLKEVAKFKKSNTKPFFLWKLNFSEVFQERGGFDVVIANPPYVRQELFKDEKEPLKRAFGNFFGGRADLYTYFYKKSLDLARSGAILTFISSNKFFIRGYGEETRRLLTTDMTLLSIINFGELPVFKAAVDSGIVIARKKAPTVDSEITTLQVKRASEIENLVETVEKEGYEVRVTNLKPGGWVLETKEKLDLLHKLQKNRRTLNEYCNNKVFAGIKTGLDKAFVITERVKEDIVKSDPESGDLIRPWLRGKDVAKWRPNYKNLYVIYTPLNKIEIDDYPAVKEYLMQFKKRLSERATQQKWYEIQQPQERFTELFDSQKIIYPDCAKEMRACYDTAGAYGTMAMYFIPYDPAILAILNSRLFDWYSRMTFATFGDPWNGGRVIFKSLYMRDVPIPKISAKNKKPLAALVEKVLAVTKDGNYFVNPAKQAEVKEYEKQIDKLVYKLYDLTPEEIEIVEESAK